MIEIFIIGFVASFVTIMAIALLSFACWRYIKVR